jgi:beta-galactosidase
MMRYRLVVLFNLSLQFTSSSGLAAPRHIFAIDFNDFLLGAQPFVVRCGEVHDPRIQKAYWRHRLQVAKAMALNMVRLSVR